MGTTIEPGDKVKHKSGGPEMIVSSISEDGIVECRWWKTRLDDFASDTFNMAELEKVVAQTSHP